MSSRPCALRRKTALSVSELERLFAAAKAGPTLFGRGSSGEVAWMLTGTERMVLYRLIAECGLRPEELVGLTAGHFRFDAELQCMSPGPLSRAGRRELLLPIGGAMTALLGEFLIGRDEASPLFNIADSNIITRTLKHDVGAAGLPARRIDGESLLTTFAALLNQSIDPDRVWSDGAVELQP